MSSSHLARLNAEQRHAVEHGGPTYADAAPLLIIAGAGSGKTNTLAHRVAHLILNGTDPRRILLLTFTRRAAAEMTRRVERIAAHALGDKAATMTGGLTWSGTFHAVGARLLREYAPQIGLDQSFTIHDREDSADLMNLARHDLGFSKTEKRFPTKGTCLAIYSRTVNAELPLEEVPRLGKRIAPPVFRLRTRPQHEPSQRRCCGRALRMMRSKEKKPRPREGNDRDFLGA